MSAALDRLLVPNTTSDWLDRRAGLEAEDRAARIKAEVYEWLKQHHPRFGGKA